METVAVIVVNWNGRHLLADCLACLRQQTCPPHQVIVVDNGSEDGSQTFLKEQVQQWDRLQCVFLPNNTGFSGGNNAAYPKVDAQVVALLNTDARPDPDWIAQGLATFKKEQVGMVACRILRDGTRTVIDKAGHLMFPDGLNRGRGTGLSAADEKGQPRFAQEEEVLWPDGCAGFYRKAMLDEIGFFDGDFFCYGEDAELGMRARWAGYTCLYQPRSLVYHHHSATLGKFSPKKAFLIERNRIWLLVKTFPLDMIILAPCYSLLRYLMNVRSLLQNKGSAAGFNQEHSKFALAKILIHALWAGLRGAPRMWVKRKLLLKRITSGQMRQLLRQHRISAKAIALED